MDVVETNTEGLLRDFKITIAANDIQQRVETRLTEVGRDVSIPGFRPGKAPLKILKQRYGGSVMGEVLEAAVQESSQEVLSERGLRPAGQPKIEVVSFDEGKDLEYDLSVEILPDIETVDLAAIELDRVKVKPTDDEIKDAIDRIAQQNRETKAIEKARPTAKGDVVIIDFVGKIDDVPFEGGPPHVTVGLRPLHQKGLSVRVRAVARLGVVGPTAPAHLDAEAGVRDVGAGLVAGVDRFRSLGGQATVA